MADGTISFDELPDISSNAGNGSTISFDELPDAPSVAEEPVKLTTEDGHSYYDAIHPNLTSADRFIVKNLPDPQEKLDYLKKRFQYVSILDNDPSNFLVQNDNDPLPYTIDLSMSMRNLTGSEIFSDLVTDNVRDMIVGERAVERGLQGAGMGAGAGGGMGSVLGPGGTVAGAGAGAIAGGVAGSIEGATEGDIISRQLVRGAAGNFFDSKDNGAVTAAVPSVQDLSQGPIFEGPAALLGHATMQGAGALTSGLASRAMTMAPAPVQRAAASVNKFFGNLGRIYSETIVDPVRDSSRRTVAHFLSKGAAGENKAFTQAFLDGDQNLILEFDEFSRELNKAGLFSSITDKKQLAGLTQEEAAKLPSTLKIKNFEKLRNRHAILKNAAGRDVDRLAKGFDDSLNGASLDPADIFDPNRVYLELGKDSQGNPMTFNQWVNNHFLPSDQKAALDVDMNVLMRTLYPNTNQLNFSEGKEILKSLYRATNYQSQSQVEQIKNTAQLKMASIIRNNLNKLYDAAVETGQIKGAVGDFAKANSRYASFLATENLIGSRTAKSITGGNNKFFHELWDAGKPGFMLSAVSESVSRATENPFIAQVGVGLGLGLTGYGLMTSAIRSDAGRAFRIQLTNALADSLYPSSLIRDAAVLATASGSVELANQLESGDMNKVRTGLAGVADKIFVADQIDGLSKKYDFDFGNLTSLSIDGQKAYIEGVEDQQDYLYDLNQRVQARELPASHVARQSSIFNNPSIPNEVLPLPSKEKKVTQPKIKLTKGTATSAPGYAY